MNIDRFIADNQATWQRLDELVHRARRRPTRLSTAELEELVTGYETVNTHLSTARTYLRDPALLTDLSTLIARAAAIIYGTQPRTWRTALRFVTDTFPAAVWHARTFVIVATAVMLVPAGALATWLAGSPTALDVAAPPALREAYVEDDFEAYYSSQPSALFTSQVTTNNIRVGILAFAAGVLLCLPTILILVVNGLNLGVAAGVFAAAGQQPRFWGLILPHGLLELSAVLIAGAAGLRLGWTLIDPGDHPRGHALTQEGRRAIVIVIGLVGVFIIAGLIEGFVTGSPLPTWARVGVGVFAEAVFISYVVVRGRHAARKGLTGAVGEMRDTGWARTGLTAGRSTSP